MRFLLSKGAHFDSNKCVLSGLVMDDHLEMAQFIVVECGLYCAEDFDRALRFNLSTITARCLQFLLLHGANIRANNDEALHQIAAHNTRDDVLEYVAYQTCYGLTREFEFKCDVIRFASHVAAVPFDQELARRKAIQASLATCLPRDCAEFHCHPHSLRIRTMNEIITNEHDRYMTERQYWDL